MKNEIDLSKAYAGQIAHLSNGQTLEIDRIGKTENIVVIWDFFGLEYVFKYCGKYIGKIEDFNSDIVTLSDPIQVQAARIDGEIKGLEKSIDIVSDLELVMGSQTYDVLYSKLAAKINQLKNELLTLQNNQ